MKLDEYISKLNGIVKDPDSAATVIPEIIDGLKTDDENLNSLMVAMSNQENKIKSLQDTNMKLFLQVTGQDNGNDEPDEVNPDDVLNDMFNNLKEE